MKIGLFDIKDFIDINSLSEIESPVVFQRGGVPEPTGLLSNEIFGVNVNDRKHRFAYIDLHGHYFHPHVYKVIKRVFRNIERIVGGTMYFSITDKGELVEDPNGDTGINFLYKNWDKIKWARTADETAARKERLDLITKTPKNQIFVKYQIVIPVFYRDVNISSGAAENDPLNALYVKLIRLASTVAANDGFSFTFNSANYQIQSTLVEIYDTFKHKLERKNGMIRKYLMGKNVDNCVRSVISNPMYHDERPEDVPARFGHTVIPMGQICTLCYPYVLAWLKNFFEQEFILQQNMKTMILKKDENGEVVQRSIYKPELYFTEKYIKNLIDSFQSNPEGRFKPIMVPVGKDEFAPVHFAGRKVDPTNEAEISPLIQRPITQTDILYLACEDAIKGKHAFITRYPVSDVYGVFFAELSVGSTSRTEPMTLNGTVYPHYPYIEPNLAPAEVLLRFVDSVQFSNSYLDGLGGDYDGDQVTVKIIWSQEANQEVHDMLYSKNNFISPAGSNVRAMKFEVHQTMWDLTKAPDDKSKAVPPDVVEAIIKYPAHDVTFTYLKNLFATRNISGKVVPRPYNPNDTVHLAANQFHNTTAINTTIGRLIWNKVMLERTTLIRFFEYKNIEMTKKEYNKFEASVTELFREDHINGEEFTVYINHRDWLGLQLHGLITCSFTEKTVKTPEPVKKLRDELFKKYEKELAAGDIFTAGKVEDMLIKEMTKYIEDDPGMDLYASGARGDTKNHMKNMFLMRGGVINPNTGKYDIMKTSFNEGLRKEDFTAASNSVVQGAYFKAVGTADSGYLAKQLMAGMQTEIVGPDGSDCGTDITLSFTLNDFEKNDFLNRYVKTPNGKTLLTSKNISSFVGKKIKLYSPMCCKGYKGFICEKCAGKQSSKFIGLDSNKIGTTLTNLNMKKFHDNVIRFSELDIKDLFIGYDGSEAVGITGENIVAKKTLEIYIPMDFFTAKLIEDMGDCYNLFGLVPVGIFEGDKLKEMTTLNVPSWNKYNIYETRYDSVDLPGVEATKCLVLRYLPGHEICRKAIIEDAVNAQMFLRQVTYGKVPTTVPYDAALNIWRKNQKLNNVNFGVPSVILEAVLAASYRYRKDPTKKFALIYGSAPGVDPYGYEMASIRRICQLNSTFTGITFEDFDSMVSTACNRSRTGEKEPSSPLEALFSA